jgi:phosphatidylinositol glycan class T
VEGTGETGTVFTNNLLLTMPLPDFTMPYNVITLTCTLIAFFFGSLFNLFTRRYYYGKTGKSGMRRVVERVTGWFFGAESKNKVE